MLLAAAMQARDTAAHDRTRAATLAEAEQQASEAQTSAEGMLEAARVDRERAAALLAEAEVRAAQLRADAEAQANRTREAAAATWKAAEAELGAAVALRSDEEGQPLDDSQQAS